MTSFAFIAGLFPLVTAAGAGELSRRGVGTAVFAGMIGSAVLGIFMIPTLYTVFEWLREKAGGFMGGKQKNAHAAEAPATAVDKALE
jgi:hypothetical protein